MEIKREHAPELAKGIGPIAGLRHLLQHEHRRNNTEDIYTLTECAHDYRIATDYHINKTPMLDEITTNLVPHPMDLRCLTVHLIPPRVGTQNKHRCG